MPNVVLYSTELTDKQKLLFCMISSLCAEKGYCRATNEYIAEKLWVEIRTIRRNISQLQEKWFIAIELEDWNKRKIRLSKEDKNVLGGGHECPGGEDKNVPPLYIYKNNTIEYIYANYYWKSKWIDEKVCNKLINNKLEQWITLDDIKKSVVLYNCDCRIKQDYKFVKKFETWIKEFQKPTDEQLEEQLSTIVKTFRDKKNSDEKFSKSTPATTIRNDLKETFGEEKVNQLWKQSSSTINLKFN